LSAIIRVSGWGTWWGTISQTAIPTDNVDEDYLKVPRKWDIGNIFKFMVHRPIGSIFDYATFFTMLYASTAGITRRRIAHSNDIVSERLRAGRFKPVELAPIE
jgi:hypothetical protein